MLLDLYGRHSHPRISASLSEAQKNNEWLYPEFSDPFLVRVV